MGLYIMTPLTSLCYCRGTLLSSFSPFRYTKKPLGWQWAIQCWGLGSRYRSSLGPASLGVYLTVFSGHWKISMRFQTVFTSLRVWISPLFPGQPSGTSHRLMFGYVFYGVLVCLTSPNDYKISVIMEQMKKKSFIWITYLAFIAFQKLTIIVY